MPKYPAHTFRNSISKKKYFSVRFRQRNYRRNLIEIRNMKKIINRIPETISGVYTGIYYRKNELNIRKLSTKYMTAWRFCLCVLTPLLQPSSLHEAIKPDTTCISFPSSSLSVKLLCDVSVSKSLVTVHVRITIWSAVPAMFKIKSEFEV